MINHKTDLFYFRQPPIEFVDELKTPLHTTKPSYFCRTDASEGEASINGAYLKVDFPDEELLLETAVADFELFLDVFEIAGESYPIVVKKGYVRCFEAYSIDVTADMCTVIADDTEGVRRALVYIEDEIRRCEGAFLPIGKTVRYPEIETRITRGSFSPTNRPPKNIDELADDIDYYPDEYLNRLAHDGANGIWIYTYFEDLLTFEDFPEYGIESAKRLEKLNKIVAKCKRYGIKVYVFAIEPHFFTPERVKKYPQGVGMVTKAGIASFCSYTALGEKYIKETTKSLYELVPGLGGFINITEGERLTVCSNFEHNECPVCKHIPRGEILAHTVDLFVEGLESSGADSEFISWTYGHRWWKYDDIEEYVKKAPAGAKFMQCFEETGIEMQLGKPRCSYDYWLSYVGPSQMFKHTAACARKYGKTLYTKLQVCTSHEIGSVPYIPVPGIIFDKYKACSEYGVKGILQCWYSGNFSCLMSKMAGEMSFEHDFQDKNKAVLRLAEIYFGRTAAPKIVKAWECFEQGYKNYPLNILFSYYGPMHDSVVWELALNPKNKELPRSWLIVDAPDGDRISDCLDNAHTLDEATELCADMSRLWNEGLEHIREFSDEHSSVARAIGVLFEGGHRVLEFYRLREQLAAEDGDLLEILDRMEYIVDQEIDNSYAMIELCKYDKRLGYHGEAEGYKFFPDKIEDRIAKLCKLKAIDFPEVRERVTSGDIPLKFYLGDQTNGVKLIKGKHTDAEFVNHPSLSAAFRATYDEKNIYIELNTDSQQAVKLYFEFTPMWPSPQIMIKNGELNIYPWFFLYHNPEVYSEFAEHELQKYSFDGKVITISREKCGWTQDKPFRLRISADDIPWKHEDAPAHTLGKWDSAPGEFMWMMP